ncbi:MAG: nucleotidyl transferase AbiEii/AbiGii toxin family protein [Thermoguttaceae bacterium]
MAVTVENWVDGQQARGRYAFLRQEATAGSGLSAEAVKKALQRLARRGRVLKIKDYFYVIVPLEYQAAGAPPVSWFINDLMAAMQLPYYVGLLTAAARHGASHRQPQEFQVITDRSVRPLTVGRTKVRFFASKFATEAATVSVKTPTGSMRVASPETTAVDLVRFVQAAGYLRNVATVLADLSSLLHPKKLLAAVRLVNDVPNARRLGYLLDNVRAKPIAEPPPCLGRASIDPVCAAAIRTVGCGRGGESPLARAGEPAHRGRCMIPQANITAWRTHAPWADDAQVEQDLALTRALVELFSNAELTGKIALRGGTALQKLFIEPPYRYSEDIDLVQTEAGPIGAILDTCRTTLDPWLGKPTRSRATGSVALVYRFESEIPPVRPLRLKIEFNLCRRRAPRRGCFGSRCQTIIQLSNSPHAITSDFGWHH